MRRLLIMLGVLLIVGGALWPWVSKMPFGRLPGDIVVDKPGFKLFFPVTTMIVISVIVSVLAWLLRR